MTHLQRATYMFVINELGFYRDMAMTVTMGLTQKRNGVVIEAVGNLNCDGGNRAAAAIELIERVLEGK